MLYDHHVHLAEDNSPLAPALTPQRLDVVALAARRAGIGVCITEHAYRFADIDDESVDPSAQTRCNVAALGRYFDLITDRREAGLPLRVGLECDWLSRSMGEFAAMLATVDADWDVVLGAVHGLAAGPYIASDDTSAWEHLTPSELWGLHARAVADAAGSGYFDVLVHIDAPKAYGGLPSQSRMTRLHAQIADALEAAGVGVEVSSAGLRGPAREIYPAQELLQMCQRRGVPITLGSDAHRPADVGRDLDAARAWAHAAGYRTVTQFVLRERYELPLID